MTPTARRIVFLSALYDLVVTAPFATPWSARTTLATLDRVHHALGLPGAALPDFGPMHLLFVNFTGTIVTLWSVLRLLHPTRENGRADTLARLAFSAWMLYALAAGASRLLGGFLLAELAWALAQGLATFGGREACGSANSRGVPASR